MLEVWSLFSSGSVGKYLSTAGSSLTVCNRVSARVHMITYALIHLAAEKGKCPMERPFHLLRIDGTDSYNHFKLTGYLLAPLWSIFIDKTAVNVKKKFTFASVFGGQNSVIYYAFMSSKKMYKQRIIFFLTLQSM